MLKAKWWWKFYGVNVFVASEVSKYWWKFQLLNHFLLTWQALISIDPVRARDDPIIVKNIPYYKAKKALEAEVMKLDVPQRPKNWGVRTGFVVQHYQISKLSKGGNVPIWAIPLSDWLTFDPVFVRPVKPSFTLLHVSI